MDLRQALRLYVIPDRAIGAPRSLLEQTVAALDGGATAIQLRDKELEGRDLLETATAMTELCCRAGALFFVNDRLDIALLCGAHGVHLGQEDLDTTDLAAIHRAGLRLGVSTHDDAELARAIAVKPSYIALGHIFPTQTKEMPSEPQGLAELQRHVAGLQQYPTVAIGGISIERVPAVLACGVGSVAVVSAITQASDWRAATATLLQLIEGKESRDAQ